VNKLFFPELGDDDLFQLYFIPM